MAPRPVAKCGLNDFTARGYEDTFIDSSVTGCKADILLGLPDFRFGPEADKTTKMQTL